MAGSEVIDLTGAEDASAARQSTGAHAAYATGSGGGGSSAGGGGGGSGAGRRQQPSAQAMAAMAAAARTGLPLDHASGSHLNESPLAAATCPSPGAAVAAGASTPPKRRAHKRSTGDSAPAERQTKKARKAKQDKEKRVDEAGKTVTFRPKPSAAVQDRIERAMPGSGHRLLLIDRNVVRPVGAEGGAAEQFAVLGATGNVYIVTISRQPRCTCPDCGKGNVCKHILFVMLRVLHLPNTEPLVWQRALLAKEVNEVLEGTRSLPRDVGGGEVLASDAVRQQFRRMSSAGDSSGSGGAAGEAAGGNQRAVEEADCPICFDSLQLAGEGISFCAACGNNVHKGCMERWAASKRENRVAVTCPLCRAAWHDGAAPLGAHGGGDQQYTNLAAFSAAHRGADTSLEALYGERALWVHASQGEISRRAAANMWRELGH